MKKFGKYAGTVFDNNDPKTLGRIKAYCPDAGFDKFPTDWAYPNFPLPGIWYTPPVGTKVWVEFEAGDTNVPIWTGCFIGAPGGKSEAPQGAGTITDIVIELLGNILAKVNGNWEEQALQKIIEAASIKLGKNATQALIMDSFGITKYNPHTHNVTAIGSPTGPPLLLYVSATDATLKVKGE